jgi:hypothetical protein
VPSDIPRSYMATPVNIDLAQKKMMPSWGDYLRPLPVLPFAL